MLGAKVVKFKMVLYIKENKLIFDISRDMDILLSDIASRSFTAYLPCSLFSSMMNLCILPVSSVHTLL